MKVVRTNLKKLYEKAKDVSSVRKAVVGALLFAMTSVGAVGMTPDRAQALDWGTLIKDAAIGAVQMVGDKDMNDTKKYILGQAAGVGVEIIEAAFKDEPITPERIRDGIARGAAAGGAAMLTKKGSSDLERAGAAFAGALGYDAAKEAYQNWRSRRAVIISEQPRPAPQYNRNYNRGYGQNASYSYNQYDQGHTRCHKVHRRIIKNGRVVQDVIEEVCDANRVEPGYHGIEDGYYVYDMDR